MQRRRFSLAASMIGILAGGLYAAYSAPAAHAQVVIYSNIADYSGSSYNQSGATLAKKDTYMLADDITVLAGHGGQNVTEFQFTVSNMAASAITAQPIINFYATDGASGNPGTFLGSVTFSPTVFAGSTVTTLAYTSPTLDAFTIPTNGLFWAGETFTGTTSATNLNDLGEGLFNPPTVGSSQDLLFETSQNGTFQASNPDGTQNPSPFGGNPVGNLGFEFEVAPEPSQFAALGTGILGLGGLMLRRRAGTLRRHARLERV